MRELERMKSRLEEELAIARAAIDEARKVQQECEMLRVECDRMQVCMCVCMCVCTYVGMQVCICACMG